MIHITYKLVDNNSLPRLFPDIQCTTLFQLQSKATVGLRHRRQKDRGTDLLGAAVCQTSNRAGQQSSREKTNDTSRGDGSCVREAYGRENVRKSQRKVKGTSLAQFGLR